MKRRDTKTVYSTETGGLCLGCRRAQAKCICSGKRVAQTGDGVVRLHRETKGRKGKGVILIKGLDIPDKELNALAKTLKSACGVGGSVKAGVIEIQSADREKIKALLDKAGFNAKIAGG